MSTPLVTACVRAKTNLAGGYGAPAAGDNKGRATSSAPAAVAAAAGVEMAMRTRYPKPGGFLLY
jgi:hypothetical protein